jgi:hypothetical protein
MIVFIPSSGQYDCNVQRAEKSPTVQPTRQREVFSPDLRHVEWHDQKAALSMDLVFCEGVSAEADLEGSFCWQEPEPDLVCIFWLEWHARYGMVPGKKRAWSKVECRCAARLSSRGWRLRKWFMINKHDNWDERKLLGLRKSVKHILVMWVGNPKSAIKTHCHW